MSYESETSRCKMRERLIGHWIEPKWQNGVDLGYGGDPISEYAIAMDRMVPYATTHDHDQQIRPQHLRGNAEHLVWFANDCLDYVYSSHLLEDFPNTEEILKEWFRVLAPRGRMILLLPNEMRYRDYCLGRGEGRNMNHQQPAMSKEWLCDLIRNMGHTILHAEDVEPYSFYVVATKQP